ncbi:MAG: hypothetical protein K9H11_19275, partial [Rhodospirillum sp.]|nr:hypothetical protein [Rhodospirillum sp.]
MARLSTFDALDLGLARLPLVLAGRKPGFKREGAQGRMGAPGADPRPSRSDRNIPAKPRHPT